jgi:hypothetical protein
MINNNFGWTEKGWIAMHVKDTLNVAYIDP